MALDEEQWKSLAQKEWGDVDNYVLDEWESMWAHYAPLDATDGTGELRYRAVVLEGFKLMLGPAQDEVNTSEGGGQSIQAEARFQHLMQLHDKAQAAYTQETKKYRSAGFQIAAITTYSLTPPLPGQYDPGHPGYAGDPRYQYRALRG